MEFDLGIYLLALSVGLSLIHYHVLSRTYRDVEHREGVSGEIPISVIIAAKNESQNLKRHLPKILAQAYDKFEVIVIDDHSLDDTASVLENLSQLNDNLSYESLVSDSGKKKAISRGIELAQNEWLLFTDADCSPASNMWIKSMASQIGPNINLILGYSPFRRTGGLANLLARVDTFMIGLQYLAFAVAGKPYMGVGRNMAYRKDLFQSTGGFKGHEHILSGDDDLFVQSTGANSNVAVALGVNSQTISDSRSSFVNWFSQKKRHTSTGFHYSFSSLFFLGLIQANNIAFYGLIACNVWMGNYLWATLFLVVLRFYSQYYVLKKSALKLGEIDLLLLSLILELPLIILNLASAFSNILFMNRRWT